jgi:hypothetical protein
MKKILILSAIALLGIASCKKDDVTKSTKYSVVYTVECQKCTMTVFSDLDHQATFDVSGKRSETVNTDDGSANILIRDILKSENTVKSSISVNGKVLSSKEKLLNGDTFQYGVYFGAP